MYENENCYTVYDIANIVQKSFYNKTQVVYPIKKCIEIGSKIKDYVRKMNKINESLVSIDLEGLMRTNPSYNQYYKEADIIFSFILTTNNFHITELADTIQQTFLENYGNLHPIVKCLEMAELICS